MDKNQKFSDILSPQSAAKVSPREKKTDASAEKLLSERTPGRFASKKIFIAFLFLMAVFVLLSQFIFNKAEIQIYPKNETLSLSEKISMAGKIFEEEKIISQEFEATGTSTEGQKAKGTIKIYNNFSDAPQVLVTNTRFISSAGKIFRTQERVTVPGKGSIDAKVIADQPGDDYNIGPETFSIPGFAGTPKYTAFYGKSFGSMSGGFLSEVAQVTKDDLERAKETVTEKAKKDGEASLKSKISSDFIVPDDAISSEIIDQGSSIAAGAKEKNFTYQLKIKFKAAAFIAADLENFAGGLIIAKTQDGKKIKEGSLKIFWEIASVDLNTGKIVLDSTLSAKVYSDINKEELAAALFGKSLQDAKLILAAREEIERAQIKSWPFWADKIPKDNAKVKIELALE